MLVYDIALIARCVDFKKLLAQLNCLSLVSTKDASYVSSFNFVAYTLQNEDKLLMLKKPVF